MHPVHFIYRDVLLCFILSSAFQRMAAVCSTVLGTGSPLLLLRAQLSAWLIYESRTKIPGTVVSTLCGLSLAERTNLV